MKQTVRILWVTVFLLTLVHAEPPPHIIYGQPVTRTYTFSEPGHIIDRVEVDRSVELNASVVLEAYIVAVQGTNYTIFFINDENATIDDELITVLSRFANHESVWNASIFDYVDKFSYFGEDYDYENYSRSIHVGRFYDDGSNDSMKQDPYIFYTILFYSGEGNGSLTLNYQFTRSYGAIAWDTTNEETPFPWQLVPVVLILAKKSPTLVNRKRTKSHK